MKRSNKINFIKHPPRNRSSSVEGFAGAHRSDNRSDATTSLEPDEDTSRVKRVRFQGPKADHHPNAKANYTPMPSEAAKGARSNNPKTSEFAFYKKIKEKACNHSYQLPKENDQVKDVKSRESSVETPFMFEQSRSYVRSSLHVEKARPLNQRHFPSPLFDASKGSGLNQVEPTCKYITPPLPINKDKPGRRDRYSPSLGGGSRNSGNQCSDKGVFSAKRQKLRQLVADTSLLEVDEPWSEGSGLVSVLLSRLFPENTENKLCRSAKSREVENDIQQQHTVFPNSGMHVKRVRKTRAMNLNAGANWPHFDGARAKSRSGPDMNRATLELDIISSGSPSTSYAARASTEYPYGRSLRNENCNRVTRFLRENDSSFLETFEGYDFTSSGHLKELEYLLDYNQPESRVQPHNHLLSWDDNSENYERDIAASCFNTDVNSFPMLETSCSDDDVQGVHNELKCLPPPLFPENSQSFPILRHYHLDSFRGNFQSRFGEENYQGALTLPSSPKYLELIEDCRPENALESSRIAFPPQDYAQEHDSSLEPFLFPTRLDFASGWKFLSTTDSSGECRFTSDAFWFLLKEGLWSPSLGKDEEEDCTYRSNALDFYEGTATGHDHDWSVSNFKRSSDTSCSLLLHDSSWDLYERGTYITDIDDYDEWKCI